MDEDVEAVFFLDFLTGELKGAALNKQLGKFTAYFAARPIDDIGADPSKNPSYMMTTGMAAASTISRGLIAARSSSSLCNAM